MRTSMLMTALVAEGVLAYPFLENVPGVDMSLLRRGNLNARQQPGSQATCPNNPNHQPAAPYTTQYPYCGATNGNPGKQFCTNNLVPAAGDTAHAYVAPGNTDIRGPCPGINTAANHNFIAHDGITTYTELVNMQQNVYGVGYDLAVLLATLGVVLDGDPFTEKMSIGCDATPRTASPGLGPELGLDGHNKFEGDTSLTRNDYFLAGGDNFSFNKTLFNMMAKTANGNFDRNAIALYRAQRYNQSRADNPNFYYGPRALLLYGAAAFVYELFPNLGNAGAPTLEIEEAFFEKETFPRNWYSRATPFTLPQVSAEVYYQYEQHPVEFGGNAGKGNFVGLGQNGGSFFNNGKFNGTSQDVACLFYQLATENVPSFLGGYSNIGVSSLQWAAGKLNPIYSQAGFPCPLNYNAA